MHPASPPQLLPAGQELRVEVIWELDDVNMHAGIDEPEGRWYLDNV